MISLVTLLVAANVDASEPSSAARARLPTLLRTGADAGKAKKWDACIEAYAEALEIEGTRAIQGELGVCEEAQGRDVDAFHHLSAALAAPGTDRKAAPWKRFGEALTRVTKRVAQVLLAVDPPDARVLVDGHPLGKADGRSVILKAGTHTIAARLDGYEDKIDTRALEDGDVSTIYLQLSPKPKPAPVATMVPSAVLKASERSEPSAGALPPLWYLPAWSERGGFVALTYLSATAALVFGAQAIGYEIDRGALARGRAPDECASDRPVMSPRCKALHDLRKARNETELVFAGAVGFAVVSAVMTALVIRYPAGSGNPTIAPTVGSHGGGIVISGAW